MITIIMYEYIDKDNSRMIFISLIYFEQNIIEVVVQ